MKTHKRVGISVCCGYATDYWQSPVSGHTCKKCGEHCETKGIDLKVFDVISRGHYRPVDNSNLGF